MGNPDGIGNPYGDVTAGRTAKAAQEGGTPYPQREAVPLYFYPFLSTRSSLARAPDVDAFAAALDRAEPRPDRSTLLYIHIPYCKNICAFCGFYRQVAHEDTEILTGYVDRLIAELRRYARTRYVAGARIEAIYVGGGTPSLLPAPSIERLLRAVREHLPIAAGTELSFEGEIRTLKDERRLAVLRELGCTRVSFGVQSFEPRVRKFSGLVPSLAELEACARAVRAFGYDVNLDLMYGLPGQTRDVWRADVARALDMGAVNVDVYDTVLYPHTALFTMRHKLRDELPGEPARLAMLAEVMDLLEGAGFLQETVEDFTRPGKAYRMKRLVYGGGDGRSEILALGASAVGQLAGMAYRNLPPDDYAGWSGGEGQGALPVQLLQEMTPVDYTKRALVFFPKLLGLRKADVGAEQLAAYRAGIEGMKARGLIEEDETWLRPTRLGLLWTDNMGMELLDAFEQQRIWKIGS